MVSHQEMVELVQAHAQLEDPMDIAIWIYQTDPYDAWLVEVLPALSADPHAERPVAFHPGRSFRYPLKLIASNLADLKAAILREPKLADAIAAGEILHGEAQAQELKAFAARSRDVRSQAG